MVVMRREGARSDWKRDRLVKATERTDGVLFLLQAYAGRKINETEVQRIYYHKPDAQGRRVALRREVLSWVAG